MVLLERTLLPIIDLFGQKKLPLTDLLKLKLLPQISLPELTGLAPTVLLGLKFLSFMGLPVWTELALTALLGRRLLSPMALPGQTELVLTSLKIDLRKLTWSRWQAELRTGTIQGNVRESSWFKLKSLEQTAFFCN